MSSLSHGSRASLAELPLDVLHLICTKLCLHCEYQSQPMVDVAEEVLLTARQGQRALARLSSTCRALRTIAQPVLFHYYHDGNMVSMADWQKWETTAYGHGDKLVCFIISSIRRPDLCRHVRAVTLSEASSGRWTHSPNEVQLIHETGERLGVPVTGQDFREFAIALTSASLRQLFLITHSSGDSGVFVDLSQSFRGNLPSLEYFAITGMGDWSGTYTDYHLAELKTFLKRTPNLAVLVAADCGADHTERDAAEWWRARLWDVGLPSLRKLSLNGLSTRYLASVIEHCPVLEDLECHIEIEDYRMLSSRQLEPIKATLRRFCYSVTNKDMQKHQWKSDNTADETAIRIAAFLEPAEDPEDGTLEMDMSFADFPRLEILELEQILLYGAAAFEEESREETFAKRKATGPEWLLSKLPPSLRILHFGMVVLWEQLHYDLLSVVAGIHSRLPLLETIRTDCYELPPVSDILELEAAFKAVGISFVVGRTPVSLWARGMLGDRPGHPISVQEPSFLYSLTR